MKAGHELNLAVAQEVMGITSLCDCNPKFYNPPQHQTEPLKRVCCDGAALPDYSRSTLLAWNVVRRLSNMGFGVCVEVFPGGADTNRLIVASTYRFKPYEMPPLGKSVPLEPPPTESFGIAEGQTEAEAICNAAINTMRAWRARGCPYVEES